MAHSFAKTPLKAAQAPLATERSIHNGALFIRREMCELESLAMRSDECSTILSTISEGKTGNTLRRSQ